MDAKNPVLLQQTWQLDGHHALLRGFNLEKNAEIILSLFKCHLLLSQPFMLARIYGLDLIFDGNIFVCGNSFDVCAKNPHKMKLLGLHQR